MTAPPVPGATRRAEAPRSEPTASARWLRADVIASHYAVRAEALLRYSRRGMLAARWEAGEGVWLFDVGRVAELFLHRDQAVSPSLRQSWGRLGSALLGGARSPRRRAAQPAAGAAELGPADRRVG